MSTLSIPTSQFRAAVAHASRMAAHKTIQSMSPVVSFRPGNGTTVIDGQMIGTAVFAQRVTSVMEQGFPAEPFSLYRDTLARLSALLPSSENIVLRHDGGSMRIECGSFSASVVKPLDPPFDGPRIGPAATTFRMDRETFLQTFGSVLYAVPRKDHRRVLRGVLVDILDRSLRTTATDGKRLRRTSMPVECEVPASFVVPHEAVAAVARVFDDGEIDVLYSTEQDGRVLFRGATWEVCANTIEGKYPECDRVIPREFPIVLEVHRKSMLDALRRAATFSEDRNRSIIIDASPDGAALSAMSFDIGRSSERIAASLSGCVPDGRVEIAFNHEFLSEALRQFPKATQVRIHIKSEQSPVCFDADGSNGSLIVMPIKLADVRGEESRPMERAA